MEFQEICGNFITVNTVYRRGNWGFLLPSLWWGVFVVPQNHFQSGAQQCLFQPSLWQRVLFHRNHFQRGVYGTASLNPACDKECLSFHKIIFRGECMAQPLWTQLVTIGVCCHSTESFSEGSVWRNLAEPPALSGMGRSAEGVGGHEAEGSQVHPFHEHVSATSWHQNQHAGCPLHLADWGRFCLSSHHRKSDLGPEGGEIMHPISSLFFMKCVGLFLSFCFKDTVFHFPRLNIMTQQSVTCLCCLIFLLFSLDTFLSFFLDVVLKQTSADSLKYSWPIKIGGGGG